MPIPYPSSDEQGDQPASEPAEELIGANRGFFVAVGIDEHLDLAQRVDALEHPTSPDDPGAWITVHARLDRHRAELEEMKRRWNALVEWLNAPAGVPAPPAPQPAPDSPEEYL